MKYIIFVLTPLLIILGWSCQQAKEGATDPGTINNMGKVSISISQAPYEITNVIATLSRPNFEDRILILSISDSGQGASGEFTDIPIGMWHLKVDAKDNLGMVRYSGETGIEVFPGQTSVVDLELLPTTGSIKIHVTWGTRCTPPPSGLVSWWPGDGTADDYTGANNGILMNGTSYGSGKVRQAFTFDGVDDYIRIPNSPSMNPRGSFTVCAWIYPVSDAIGNVISKWGDEYNWWNQRSFLVELRPNRIIRFALSDSLHQLDPDFHIFETEENVITLNSWNHVVAVYSKEGGARLIYLNGHKVAERIDLQFNVFSSIADVSIGVVKRSPTTFHPTFFKGKIDEVDFFNRALSEREINGIFRAGSSGKCKR